MTQSGHKIGIYYGAEALADHVTAIIWAFTRANKAICHGDLDIRSWQRLSLSAGVREEFYGQAQAIAVPALSARGYWLSAKFKLRASASRAFRLPNYTDLYYHDPGTIGNPNLKPEKAMNYEAGLDWHPASHLRGSFTAFTRRETDDIDYIRANSSEIWQATNFARLTMTGWEASLDLVAAQIANRRAGIHRTARRAGSFNGYQSEYVFNFPTQQAVIAWQRTSGAGWIARVRTGMTNQYQRNAYVLVDAYAAWTRSRLHPYVRLTNLTNADYQPVYGVVMPGRAALVGVEWRVF